MHGPLHLPVLNFVEFLASGKMQVKVLPDQHFGLIDGKAGVITLPRWSGRPRAPVAPGALWARIWRGGTRRKFVAVQSATTRKLGECDAARRHELRG
jgi:hypothetical protein